MAAGRGRHPLTQLDEMSLRYKGWPVAVACLIVTMFICGFGLYGHGVYLAALQQLHGWPTALIAGGSTLSFLLSNFLTAFTGDVLKRISARGLVLLGIVALSASTTMLAWASTPWELYLGYIFLALAWFGMSNVLVATVVSFWFVRRRGLAISLAFAGASAGGAVVTPLLVWLVEKIGFPLAMMTMTGIMIVVLVPIVLVWIVPPSEAAKRAMAGQVADRTPVSGSSGASEMATVSRGMLFRQFGFWTISLPLAMAILVQVGFIVHQISIIEPKIGRTGAGLTVSVLTIMSLTGRLALGFFIDRLEPRVTTAVMLVSQAAALLTLGYADSLPVVMGACAVFGFSIGNMVTMGPLIINREYNTASFAVALGLSNAIIGTISAIGPVVVGFIAAASGDYNMAVVACVVLQLAAALIVLQRGTRRPAAAA